MKRSTVSLHLHGVSVCTLECDESERTTAANAFMMAADAFDQDQEVPVEVIHRGGFGQYVWDRCPDCHLWRFDGCCSYCHRPYDPLENH